MNKIFLQVNDQMLSNLNKGSKERGITRASLIKEILYKNLENNASNNDIDFEDELNE